MPRDGSGIYTQPLPDVVSATTISSTVYNQFVNDVEQDLNAARPIVAGGTGANLAGTALFNLAGAKAAQLVTNYDSHLFVPGTFYSDGTATGEPVNGEAYSGIAYIGEPLANPPTNANVVIEARSATDGRLWIRRKVAGVWGAWILDGDLSGVTAAIALKVAKAGDTMTGPLELPAAAPTLGVHATNKTYVDSGDTAAAAVGAAANTNANGRVSKGGDTMTGFLVLHADPDAALKAATKQYVDNRAVRYDGSQSLTPAQALQARSNISASMRGLLWGLTLSAAGSTATFGIALGEAVNSTNTDLMVLASAYTKTTSAWAVGSGNGAMDTGSVAASTWYHVHLIKRLDTGVVDVLFSLSPTAPTLPANYTIFRRIGSMKTDGSSQWVKFTQIGDEFLWDLIVGDVAASAPGSSGSLYVLSVPTGIQVNVIAAALWFFSGTGNYCQFASPDQASVSTVIGNATLYSNSGTTPGSAQINVRTNTSAQIRARSDGAGGSLYVNTIGWVDTRGKLV